LGKKRLDSLLVELNLCDSRMRAQRLILAGAVRVNQQLIDKPGTEVETSAEIVVEKKPLYVSRGGEKLAKALEEFKISVQDRICLDGGISSGGFTDCLLQNGARQVYGIDVGYGQVAWNLRQDRRVVLRERTNFRYLTPPDLYGEGTLADLGVMDLSFISLTKVLPTLWELLTLPKEAILLVKPQFEVGRQKVGRKGVVRDRKDHSEAIAQVVKTALGLGWYMQGLTYSPLQGPAGNIEYLLWLGLIPTEGESSLPTIDSITSEAVAHFQN